MLNHCRILQSKSFALSYHFSKLRSVRNGNLLSVLIQNESRNRGNAFTLADILDNFKEFLETDPRNFVNASNLYLIFIPVHLKEYHLTFEICN